MKRIDAVGRFTLFGFVAVAIVAVLLAMQISQMLEKNALEDAVSEVKSATDSLIVGRLTPSDLTAPLTGERYEEFDRVIRKGVLSERREQVNVWNREGQVIYSSNPNLIGSTTSSYQDLKKALSGETVTLISELEDEESVDDANNGDSGGAKYLEIYAPVRFEEGGEILGVYEVYHPWAQPANRILETQRVALIWLGIAFAAVFLVGLVMLRASTRRISHLLNQAEKRAGQLESANARLMDTHLSTLSTLAAAVEARDPYTYGHSLRVTDYALAFAKELSNGDEKMLETLQRAAMLHDIGKIGIADSILRKPGKLEPEEYEEMKHHAEIGYNLLQRVPFLKDELLLIRHHHERYDGLGYPLGLKNQEIPLGARILQVADALDAMTSDRPYRAALTLSEARAELERNAGIMFCPETIEAALRVIDHDLAPAFEMAREIRRRSTAGKEGPLLVVS